MRGIAHICVAGVMALGAALAGMDLARAQSDDGAALLTQGTRAVAGGEHEDAVKALTRALKDDSLSSAQIAKAFYQRGLAYRALDRPANAVADFTSALWLDGLSEEEQKLAQQHRSTAFQTAGARQAPQAASGGGGSNERTASIAPFQTSVESAPQTLSPRPSQQSEPRAAAERDAPPAQSTDGEPDDARTGGDAPIEPGDGDSEDVQLAEGEAAAGDGDGTRIGRFFSNLLPSREASAEEPSQPAPASAQSWSARTEAESPPSPSARQEPARTARATPPPAASWGRSTSVTPSERQAARSDAPAASGDDRSYRLQLASVRSESEAEAVWQRLASKHQDLIGEREPAVRRADLGDRGVFYRVQLGPIAGRAESLKLCNAFKQGGTDCLLVAE